MIQVHTAYTLEVDDMDCALSEILEQLDLANQKHKYAAGIMFCHPDFIETGVAQKIAEALPFEVVGGVSLCSFTDGFSDLLGLSLSVLTSDSVSFSAFTTQDVTREGIEKAYRDCVKGREEKPALIMPFAPLKMGSAIELTISVLDELTGGVPIFGSTLVEASVDFSKIYSLHNGEASQDAMVMLLVWGDVSPQFYVAEMSNENVQKQSAIITKSEGSLLMTVNNVPVVEYMESIGITREQASEGMPAIPFVIDLGDGTKPVARAFHSITEEGYARVGGTMPEKATIAIGSLQPDDVIRMARETMDYTLSTCRKNGALVFPCASHFLVLGPDAAKEIRMIQDKLGRQIPHQVCYSGGEICPVYDKEGKLHNRFHSYTCAACIF